MIIENKREQDSLNEGLDKIKGEIRKHMIVIIKHMMKSIVQNTYEHKVSWRKSVTNSNNELYKILKKGGAASKCYYSLDDSSFDVKSGFSNEFDEIKQEAWEEACEEMELYVPHGSTKEKVFDDEYRKNEAMFMSWSLENLADKKFIEDFKREYMQDYAKEDLNRYLK